MNPTAENDQGAVEEVAPAAPVESAPTTQDATTAPSPVSEESEFQAEVEKIQAKKTDTADSQPAEKVDSESAEVSPEAKTDEPADGKPAADLSKPVEPDTGFSGRPEWKKAVEIADKLGPAAGKEMRQTMRNLLTQENELKTQVEQFKPAVERIDRITKAAGPEGVEGSIRLIEGWSAGEPGARQILVNLLEDFDRRTGNILSSPELLEESKRLDQEVADGVKTPEEIAKRKAELLELERSRATAKQVQTRAQQTESQTKAQAEQAAEQRRSEEVVTAANDWQKRTAGKDPDYPALAGLHERLAKAALAERLLELGRGLTGAEAVKLLNETYQAAKDEAKKFRPKPKAIVPVNGGNGSSAKTKPVFKDEEDEFYATVRSVQGQA